MYIRCPKCGRRGHLPEKWVPEARSLRCRKCGALFKTPELSRMAAEGRSGAAFDALDDLGPSETSSSFGADGFFSAFEDVLISRREPGPGDSNYELTFTLREAEGDSGAEWEAEGGEFEPEAPSSDEIPAAGTGAGAAAEPEPWHHRFIRSYGLALIAASLLLIAVSVPIIAYLLWRTVGPGQPLEMPSPTLIAGFACAVAMLMISVPLILLAASVTELVRDLRRVDRGSELRGILGRR